MLCNLSDVILSIPKRKGEARRRKAGSHRESEDKPSSPQFSIKGEQHTQVISREIIGLKDLSFHRPCLDLSVQVSCFPKQPTHDSSEKADKHK